MKRFLLTGLLVLGLVGQCYGSLLNYHFEVNNVEINVENANTHECIMPKECLVGVVVRGRAHYFPNSPYDLFYEDLEEMGDESASVSFSGPKYIKNMEAKVGYTGIGSMSASYNAESVNSLYCLLVATYGMSPRINDVISNIYLTYDIPLGYENYMISVTGNYSYTYSMIQSGNGLLAYYFMHGKLYKWTNFPIKSTSGDLCSIIAYYGDHVWHEDPIDDIGPVSGSGDFSLNCLTPKLNGGTYYFSLSLDAQQGGLTARPDHPPVPLPGTLLMLGSGLIITVLIKIMHSIWTAV